MGLINASAHGNSFSASAPIAGVEYNGPPGTRLMWAKKWCSPEKARKSFPFSTFVNQCVFFAKANAYNKV